MNMNLTRLPQQIFSRIYFFVEIMKSMFLVTLLHRQLHGGAFKRPFWSCFEPHYENAIKHKIFKKISFYSNANKTNFNMKSFALSLSFIMMFTATWERFALVFYNVLLATGGEVKVPHTLKPHGKGK